MVSVNRRLRLDQKMRRPDFRFSAEASVTLEELGLPYKKEIIDISKNTQKEPWFLASECLTSRIQHAI